MTAQAWMRHSEFQRRRRYDDAPCSGTLVFGAQTGPVWELKCDKCGFEAGLPAREASPKVRAEMRANRSGFPGMFAGKPFETTAANEPVKGMIREWISSYRDGALPAPSIYGKTGRGKSHLLVATCEQLILRHDTSVWFQSAAKLLDDLQHTFSDEREHHRIWERAKTVDLLALDDLGAEQATDWRRDRLAQLVDERYQAELPILIASNYAPSSWDDLLGDRSSSRLISMTFQAELLGDDRRVREAA